MSPSFCIVLSLVLFLFFGVNLLLSPFLHFEVPLLLMRFPLPYYYLPNKFSTHYLFKLFTKKTIYPLLIWFFWDFFGISAFFSYFWVFISFPRTTSRRELNLFSIFNTCSLNWFDLAFHVHSSLPLFYCFLPS